MGPPSMIIVQVPRVPPLPPHSTIRELEVRVLVQSVNIDSGYIVEKPSQKTLTAKKLAHTQPRRQESSDPVDEDAAVLLLGD